MLVYKETKKQFLLDVRQDLIEQKIENRMIENLHRHTGHSEIQSWMNSMQYMYKVMEYSAIPNNSEIAIEYKIPNSNKRVDFIISGQNDEGRESAVIVELKQWQEVEKVPNKDGIVKTILHGKKVETIHPSYQAWSYVSLIQDYNEDVRNHHILLQPCAYLHNYRPLSRQQDLLDAYYNYYIEKAPVFVRGDTEKLAKFISKFIKKGNPEVLYHIDCGKIKPSKSLQDNISAMIQGKEEFKLIDDDELSF